MPVEVLVAKYLKEANFAEGVVQICALAAQGNVDAAQACMTRLEQYVGDESWLVEKVKNL